MTQSMLTPRYLYYSTILVAAATLLVLMAPIAAAQDASPELTPRATGGRGRYRPPRAELFLHEGEVPSRSSRHPFGDRLGDKRRNRRRG